jgi:hypothetical protein
LGFQGLQPNLHGNSQAIIIILNSDLIKGSLISLVNSKKTTQFNQIVYICVHVCVYMCFFSQISLSHSLIHVIDFKQIMSRLRI